MRADTDEDDDVEEYEPRARRFGAAFWAGLLVVPLIGGALAATILGNGDGAICFTVALSALAIISAMREFAEHLGR